MTQQHFLQKKTVFSVLSIKFDIKSYLCVFVKQSKYDQ